MGCFRCDNCDALNIAIAHKWVEGRDPLAWLASKRYQEWQPQPVEEEPDWDFPDVPVDIAAAASEAYACCYRDANRAAVLMARAVIEATAKNKGIKKGTLLDKIDALSHLIRPHVLEGAHEVRLLGNEMAHGDFVRRVSDEDAKLVLTLMSEVLDDVYQSPARVARAQAAREEGMQQQALAAAMRDGKVVPGQMAPAMLNAFKPLTIPVDRAAKVPPGQAQPAPEQAVNPKT
jgi:hypothetical protein